MLALQVPAEILPHVHNGDDHDSGVGDAIDETIGRFDQLADVNRRGFGDAPARFRKLLGLGQASDDALDDLLRVNPGRETDVFSKGTELIDGVLRPAELEAHEARRIRLRMRAMASSWATVCPALASASPISIAWRT